MYLDRTVAECGLGNCPVPLSLEVEMLVALLPKRHVRLRRVLLSASSLTEVATFIASPSSQELLAGLCTTIQQALTAPIRIRPLTNSVQA